MITGGLDHMRMRMMEAKIIRAELLLRCQQVATDTANPSNSFLQFPRGHAAAQVRPRPPPHTPRPHPSEPPNKVNDCHRNELSAVSSHKPDTCTRHHMSYQRSTRDSHMHPTSHVTPAQHT